MCLKLSGLGMDESIVKSGDHRRIGYEMVERIITPVSTWKAIIFINDYNCNKICKMG
jgi:hypothetical protein